MRIVGTSLRKYVVMNVKRHRKPRSRRLRFVGVMALLDAVDDCEELSEYPLAYALLYRKNRFCQQIHRLRRLYDGPKAALG